jgi:hypothetical protein
MQDFKTGCLVCGRELEYGSTLPMECLFCHNEFESKVRCTNGHFICDQCHSFAGNDLIERFCITTRLDDPLEIAVILMKQPSIKMHGPEHHFLVPAVLLTAYYNLKNDQQKKELAIKEAKQRAICILGGFCGFYGTCGAAVGTGIFVSLITNATPLSSSEWRFSNLITAKSLLGIANHGGPRCCKRNTYLAINEAITFVQQNFQVKMKRKTDFHCEFTAFNQECLKQQCPYYAKKNP